MRTVVGLGTGLMMLAATPAMAQSGPRAPAMLAPGEVPLHIVAHAEVTTRADRITVTVPITGKGATADAARAAAQGTADKLSAALAAAGVGRGAITTKSGSGDGMDFMAAALSRIGMGGDSDAAKTPSVSATMTMTLVATDRAGLDRMEQVLAAQGQRASGKPMPTLADDAAARRGAITAAIAKARRDADDYAAATGMHVVRVTAVSNAAGFEEVAAFASFIGDLINQKKSPDEVMTPASAVVDFALKP